MARAMAAGSNALSSNGSSALRDGKPIIDESWGTSNATLDSGGRVPSAGRRPRFGFRPSSSDYAGQAGDGASCYARAGQAPSGGSQGGVVQQIVHRERGPRWFRVWRGAVSRPVPPQSMGRANAIASRGAQRVARENTPRAAHPTPHTPPSGYPLTAPTAMLLTTCFWTRMNRMSTGTIMTEAAALIWCHLPGCPCWKL